MVIMQTYYTLCFNRYLDWDILYETYHKLSIKTCYTFGTKF